MAQRPVYEVVEEERDEIFRIAAVHGASHVRLVGAVGRGDGRFDSDIDLLMTWREGADPSGQAALSAELESLLERKVGIASHDGSRDDAAAAYYRDIVRPRILQTAPVDGTIDPVCELHVLTCRNDWLDLVWSLKSFYHFSGRRYALAIHDDGTVPPHGIEHLRRLFPQARLINRSDADARIQAELRHYPRCLEFRQSHPVGQKPLDFAAFLESDRMLMYDSDLLFFKQPTALLERIEDPAYRKNVFNADCQNGYTVDPDAVRGQIGLELVPLINGGLGLIHKGSLRADWCEEFLGLPGLLGGPFWWNEEQTLVALCSSRFGAELLPEEYTLRLDPGIGGRPFRHYINRIRHPLMYSEGIRALVEQHFLPWHFVVLLESGRL
jgi:predicted nucleotidyltransferase